MKINDKIKDGEIRELWGDALTPTLEEAICQASEFESSLKHKTLVKELVSTKRTAGWLNWNLKVMAPALAMIALTFLLSQNGAVRNGSEIVEFDQAQLERLSFVVDECFGDITSQEEAPNEVSESDLIAPILEDSNGIL